MSFFSGTTALINGNQAGQIKFASPASSGTVIWGLSAININASTPAPGTIQGVTLSADAGDPSGGIVTVTPIWTPELEANSTCMVSALMCDSALPSDVVLLQTQGLNNGEAYPIANPLSSPPFASVAWLNGMSLIFNDNNGLVALGAGAGIANTPVLGPNIGPTPALISTAVFLGDEATNTTTVDLTGLCLTDQASNLGVALVPFLFPGPNINVPISTTIRGVTVPGIESFDPKNPPICFIQSFYGQFEVQPAQMCIGNPILSVGATVTPSTTSANAVDVTVTMNMCALLEESNGAANQQVDALACNVVVIGIGPQ